MAYVYKHVRLDTNEVFYIGIGIQDKYKRAFSKRSRNAFWKNITSKTEYLVEIISDNITWEEACIKEKQMILELGRRDLKLGSLVNMTDGGEGTINVKHSKQWYEKQKENNLKKGKPISKEHRLKISLNHKSKNIQCNSGNKSVDAFDKNWNFIKSYNSILEASKDLNIGRWVIDKYLSGETKRPNRYRFKYK